MKKEIRVYIASPYTNGRMTTNVKRQIDMSHKLLDLGYYPYTPLLNHFLEIYSLKSEHKWLDLDFVYLKVCDALLRLKSVDDKGKEIYSAGAEEEEKLAKEIGIPVFYSIESLNDYFKSGYEQSKIF